MKNLNTLYEGGVKMKKKDKVFVAIVLFLVLVVLPILIICVQPAQGAETFPSKSIRFIIGGVAGDAYDINGRKFAPTLGKKLGVDVLPVNALGPMSVHFFDAVHVATPDGYNLGFGGALHRMYHIIKPGRLKYDVTTLPVVAAINTFPDVVWASSKSKLNLKTANDLLNFKGPIKVNLFSPILVGVCSLAILAKERNLDLRPIIYEGFPEGHVAMLRGDVDIGTTTVSGAPLKYIRAGHYIPLFVWGKERYKELPETPCSRELGLNPDLEDTIQQRVFLLPPGTPSDRVAKLSQGIEAMLTDPEMVRWGKEADQPLFFMTADEFEKTQGKLLRFYMKHIEALRPFLK